MKEAYSFARWFYRASKLEHSRPRRALGIYEQIESRNRPFSFIIFLSAIGFPLLAMFLLHVISGSSGQVNRGISVAMLIVVGYAPPLFYYKLRLNFKDPYRQPALFRAFLIALFNSVLLVYLSAFLELFLALLPGAIMATPIIFLVNLPLHFLYDVPFFWNSMVSIMYPIALGITAVFSLIAFLTQMTFHAMRQPNGVYPSGIWGMLFIWPAFVKQMPVVLKYSAGQIYSVFVDLAVLAALTQAGLHFQWLKPDGVIVATIAGLFLGLEFSRKLERDYQLGNITRLGKARCLLLLKKHRDALNVLRTIEADTPEFSFRFALKPLINILGYYIRGYDVEEGISGSLDNGYNIGLRKPRPTKKFARDEYVTMNIEAALAGIESSPRQIREYLTTTFIGTMKMLKIETNSPKIML